MGGFPESSRSMLNTPGGVKESKQDVKSCGLELLLFWVRAEELSEQVDI